jgi:hypothetical protein
MKDPYKHVIGQVDMPSIEKEEGVHDLTEARFIL